MTRVMGGAGNPKRRGLSSTVTFQIDSVILGKDPSDSDEDSYSSEESGALEGEAEQEQEQYHIESGDNTANDESTLSGESESESLPGNPADGPVRSGASIVTFASLEKSVQESQISNNIQLQYVMTAAEERRLKSAFLASSCDYDKDPANDDSGIVQSHHSAPDVELAMLPTDPEECERRFRTILVSLGLQLDADELKRLYNKMLADGSGSGGLDPAQPLVTYEVFKNLYLSTLQGSYKENDLLRYWSDLHAGTGQKVHSQRPYISALEFRKIMTTEGEKLTEEEAEEMLRECKPDASGRIFYEGYRRMLIDQSLIG